MRAQFAQFAGDDIACQFGPSQQHALPFHPLAQAIHHRLSDVLLWHHVHSDAQPFDGLLCGRADGGDPQVPQIFLAQAALFHALSHRLDTVHAGKDQPVVVEKIFQGRVQGLIGTRSAHFNEWDFDHFRAQYFQT